ncbi:hypothetical protein [Acidiphilium sp. 37-64-53]|nr:hypothetical protein [Acidiphilium sp. 37-64-53]
MAFGYLPARVGGWSWGVDFCDGWLVIWVYVIWMIIWSLWADLNVI